MRIAPIALTIAFAGLSVTDCLAADVRILMLPESVVGTWAPSAEACRGSASTLIRISPTEHSTSDATCKIAWITVTASRDGPSYSARSNCARTTGGPAEPPSYFLVTLRPDGKLMVRTTDAAIDSEPVTYQKCQ